MKVVFKNPLNKVVGGIDKKLEKLDPLWQSEHGVGGLRSRYPDKTGIAKYREWRGVQDTMVDYTAWLKNLSYMGIMVAKDPVHMLKGFWEYRWMGSFLGSFAFVDRLFEGYRGPELVIAGMHGNAIVKTLTTLIGNVLRNDVRLGGGPMSDKIVGMDETIPPLFMAGFPNLLGLPMQTLPEFVICDVDQHIEPYYIDIAESYGLPADVCSRCSAETGVAFDDAFPIFGRAVLSTNQPCNASEATSMFQRRRFLSQGIQDYPFAFAMQHNEPGGNIYSAQELRNTIKFLEEAYDEKYDWSALFKAAKDMNEQNQIELEKWEILKTPYSALGGISETLYKLVEWAMVNGRDPYMNKVDRKVIKIMEREYERKHMPFGGKTRHRAFLWGPSAVYYTDFPTWTQNCWGLSIVLNMDSTMGHNMINTEDPQQALIDLAKFSEKGVMRHHAVGGWDNVNAVWDWAKKMNCDMVMVNDNVSCKGMNGVHAMLEEQARDLGLYFMFLEHDLEDCRTISRRDMRNQVNNYMTVVLGEKPLDATLVDFDDSEAW
ncbi:MAG: 2-hydroxyacyl-CoA dehydratase family protein [Oscillospiraceae bacterium]